MKFKSIITLLTLMFLVSCVSTGFALNINYVTDTNTPLDTEGYIGIESNSINNVICSLKVNNNTVSDNIHITTNKQNIYYAGLEEGYNTFELECRENMGSPITFTEQYIIPKKHSSFPYLLTYILVLLSTLLVKPFGLLQRITRNNPYMEFVIYAMIILMTFMYGYPFSAFYDELLFMFARIMCGFSLFMSLWFILIEAINSFNRRGV